MFKSLWYYIHRRNVHWKQKTHNLIQKLLFLMKFIIKRSRLRFQKVMGFTKIMSAPLDEDNIESLKTSECDVFYSWHLVKLAIFAFELCRMSVSIFCCVWCVWFILVVVWGLHVRHLRFLTVTKRNVLSDITDLSKYAVQWRLGNLPHTV